MKRTKVRRKKAKAPPKTPISEITAEQQIIGGIFLGKVRDYFARINVITVLIEAPLSVGDSIWIKGHTTDLTQRVERLELEHRSVSGALAGEEVAVAVADRVRRGDAVFKI